MQMPMCILSCSRISRNHAQWTPKEPGLTCPGSATNYQSNWNAARSSRTAFWLCIAARVLEPPTQQVVLFVAASTALSGQVRITTPTAESSQPCNFSSKSREIVLLPDVEDSFDEKELQLPLIGKSVFFVRCAFL